MIKKTCSVFHEVMGHNQQQLRLSMKFLTRRSKAENMLLSIMKISEVGIFDLHPNKMCVLIAHSEAAIFAS